MKVCDRCGKEMTNDTGHSLQGMSVKVHASIKGFDTSFLRKQMGKYELETEYTVCFECLIDNMLGVSGIHYETIIAKSI